MSTLRHLYSVAVLALASAGCSAILGFEDGQLGPRDAEGDLGTGGQAGGDASTGGKAGAAGASGQDAGKDADAKAGSGGAAGADASDAGGAAGSDANEAGGAAGGDAGDADAQDEGVPCTTAGERKCAGPAQPVILECIASKMTWSVIETCTGDQLCDSTDATCQHQVPVCLNKQPGEVVCDGAILHKCGPDLVNSETLDCAETALCQPALGFMCAACVDGQHACEGAKMQICASDHKSFVDKEVCATPELCNAVSGLCTAEACQTGDHACEGDVLKTCNAGHTALDVIEATCLPGLCDAAGGQCDICVPGQQSCMDLQTQQACSSDGQSQPSQACGASTPWCIAAGVCVQCRDASDCTAATCFEPGCVTNTCGTTPAPVGTACNATGVCNGQGVCGVCAPDALRCAGDVLQRCSALGHWEDQTICPYVCNAGQCGGICKPAVDHQCAGDVLQTCDAQGMGWVNDQTCQYVCAAGSCTGICKPGTKQCTGDIAQECDAGGTAWSDTQTCPFVCAAGNCTGVCTPGSKRCTGWGVLETCKTMGEGWDVTQVCDGSTPVCTVSGCQPRPSCAGLTTLCNDGGKQVSCCDSKTVPGGQFMMGRSASGTDACPSGLSQCATHTWELPEHPATVGDFHLDTFIVTVGRFRAFTDAYDAWRAAGNPAVDAGAHPLIDGSGWQSAWTASLPSNASALRANLNCGANQTWSNAPAGKEALPLNCVNWYTATTFCLWDGGRVPTEAEWEYAAAGGSENRLFPWGAQMPDSTLADYTTSAPDAVGSHPKGAARWGHQDLAGGLWEWVQDWYSESWYSGPGNPCLNCALLSSGTYRVTKGGSWGTGMASYQRAAYRAKDFPSTNTQWYVGLRCARSAPPCTPGEKRCSGKTPVVCGQDGTWSSSPACAGGTPVCDGGECAPGGWIVYWAEDSGQLALWAAPDSGGTPVRLSNGYGPPGSGAGWIDVAPDGKHIAFGTRDNQALLENHIRVMAIDGGSLTSHYPMTWGLSWENDSTHVVYSRAAADDLYRMNGLNPSEPDTLLLDYQSAYDPRSNPVDPNELVYNNYVGLAKLNVQTKQLTQVFTHAGDGYHAQVNYSPDGTSIIHVAYQPGVGGSNKLYTRVLTGTQSTLEFQTPNANDRLWYPEFGDNTKLAYVQFMEAASGQTDVAKVDLASKTLKRLNLHLAPNAAFFAWGKFAFDIDRDRDGLANGIDPTPDGT